MLIIGIQGKQLTETERAWIAAPQVSGVILFTRNFASREQVTELVDDMRLLRPAEFLVCVDQEGGPVQRFRDGLTRLPALARIGQAYDRNPQIGIALAEEHAWVMASEMRALDVDLSFAPVLDLRRGNRCIGERALHADPIAVSELGLAYVRGMRLAGMAATIKHFPGHGSVLEDTHVERVIDARTLEELRQGDLVPFVDALAGGAEAVMLGHVQYPAVDAKIASRGGLKSGKTRRQNKVARMLEMPTVPADLKTRPKLAGGSHDYDWRCPYCRRMNSIKRPGLRRLRQDARKRPDDSPCPAGAPKNIRSGVTCEDSSCTRDN